MKRSFVHRLEFYYHAQRQKQAETWTDWRMKRFASLRAKLSGFSGLLFFINSRALSRRRKPFGTGHAPIRLEWEVYAARRGRGILPHRILHQQRGDFISSRSDGFEALGRRFKVGLRRAHGEDDRRAAQFAQMAGRGAEGFAAALAVPVRRHQDVHRSRLAHQLVQEMLADAQAQVALEIAPRTGGEDDGVVADKNQHPAGRGLNHPGAGGLDGYSARNRVGGATRLLVSQSFRLRCSGGTLYPGRRRLALGWGLPVFQTGVPRHALLGVPQGRATQLASGSVRRPARARPSGGWSTRRRAAPFRSASGPPTFGKTRASRPPGKSSSVWTSGKQARKRGTSAKCARQQQPLLISRNDSRNSSKTKARPRTFLSP